MSNHSYCHQVVSKPVPTASSLLPVDTGFSWDSAFSLPSAPPGDSSESEDEGEGAEKPARRKSKQERRREQQQEEQRLYKVACTLQFYTNKSLMSVAPRAKHT